MKKLFVGSLPASANEAFIEDLFSPFGKVHSIKLVKDLFSGQCKGFGFVEMEGHEARDAIAELNGKSVDGNHLKVGFEKERGKGRKGRR